MISAKYHRVFRIGGIVLFVVTCTSVFMLWEVRRSQKFSVHFFDVGQGDAILLSQGSRQVLIDSGANGVVLLEELGNVLPFWDRTIEVVIATHPDSDHIGGFSDVLKNYSVQYFFTTTQRKESETFSVMQGLIAQYGVAVHFAQAGDRITFSQDVFLDVMYPFESDTSAIADANDASIAVVVHVGDEEFFLAGDLPRHVEDLLPVRDTITILKASHHGSKTSTSDYFLDKVQPRDVIISAGKENRYNHPSEEVMQRLHKRNLTIFRTDRDGTIIYTCTEQCTVDF